MNKHFYYFWGLNLIISSMDKQYVLLKNLAGWIVFAITFIVFAATTERTGSLWDVGEFIAGAYKLHVGRPPGAPLFLFVGRLFGVLGAGVAEGAAWIAFSLLCLVSFCRSLDA